MNDQNGQSRVVIVGGGFAGLFAARMLARAPVQVTLIDRAEHHLFQPMLYQCATGILSEGKIAAPLRQLLAKHRNVEFVIAEATGLDAAGRRVLARRPLGEQVDFGYDYLILAAGVRQSYFGHDEYAPIAPGMKTIEDAMKIRRRIFGAFEMAESAGDPAERARWLTFALVGAGPTGVELAGQIREVATKTLRSEYRHIKPEDARVLLFDGGDAPLAMFGPKLSALAARDLGKLGVELHMGSIVTHVDPGGLEVKDHDGTVTRHVCGNVLWTAGVEAPPLAAAVAKATGAQQDRAGRIVVGKDLAIPGHPEILVTGDVMSLDKLPGVAEVAMQTGLYAGRKVSPPGPRAELRQAVQVPRPGLGRLHLPRESGRLGVQAELRRLPGLVGLAVHPHRLPHRLPQPHRSGPGLVVRVHPRYTPGTDLHHRRHATGGGPAVWQCPRPLRRCRPGPVSRSARRRSRVTG